jgi:hypothetical protein
MKTIEEITEMYDDYDQMVKAFEKMSPDHEDYKAHADLIGWCNKKY